MTFDKFEGRKKMEDNGWNLSRFCNKLNTTVIGGASKLLSYFIKTYNPSRIVSYADKSWSNGSLYDALNFKKVSTSSPDYKYIVDNKRSHKSNFTKSKLKEMGWSFDSEKNIMYNLKNYRIYDCGKYKYEWKINK